MTFNEYQAEALKTATFTPIGHASTYPAMGLAGEAGEVLDKIKKVWRDGNGEFTEDKVKAIVDEIGDVMWYCAVLAHTFNVNFEAVADTNIAKLKSRRARNVIHGSGDNR